MTHQRHASININMKSAGSHDGAWRHPDTDVTKVNDFRALADFARKAEAAGVDALFFADGLSYSAPGSADTPPSGFEPVSLMGALAAVTSRIGYIGTISTTYSEPYNLARQLASLDRISGGRIGWNIVTTAGGGAAANFSLNEHPEHSERYRRAGEFVEVATKLWDSWGADAIVADKSTGRYVNADQVHPINHQGSYYSVAGPLNIPRSPQGHPLLVQAGSSEDGRDFAARYAEVVYSISQTIPSAKRFYEDIKTRAENYGRDPDSIKIVMGIRVLVEKSAQQAHEKDQYLRELADPQRTLKHLGGIIGVDLTQFPLDGPVPPIPEPTSSNAMQTHVGLLAELVQRERPATVRELVDKLNGGVGAVSVTGDGPGVADALQEWLEAGVVDGFNVGLQILQGGGENFFDLVIPELVRRGLRSADYQGDTLRQYFGLPR